MARDRYAAAADALNAIEVDYEPLPPVLDIRTALEDSSPRVHGAGNLSCDFSSPADLDGAADYRRHLARVLTGRALAAAADL